MVVHDFVWLMIVILFVLLRQVCTINASVVSEEMDIDDHTPSKTRWYIEGVGYVSSSAPFILAV